MFCSSRADNLCARVSVCALYIMSIYNSSLHLYPLYPPSPRLCIYAFSISLLSPPFSYPARARSRTQSYGDGESWDSGEIGENIPSTGDRVLYS